MANPVSDYVKKLADKYKTGNQETTSLGSELSEKARMSAGVLGSDSSAAAAAPASGKPAGGGKPAQGPYGSQGKEKRIDTTDMTKPLGAAPVYDKGGKVNIHDGKHQVAILKEGERVLTPEQTKAYDKGGKVMATPYDMVTGGKTPKKEIKEMVHTKSHNGKHIVTHKHHSPAHHPDEIHAFNDLDEAKDHMDQHAGPEPAEGAAPLTAAPSPMGGPAGAGAPPPAGM